LRRFANFGAQSSKASHDDLRIEWQVGQLEAHPEIMMLASDGRLVDGAGEPIGGNPEAWLNLIHGDDAATACVAALTAPSPGPLYLISDDQPLRRRDYFEALASRIGAPPPRFSGEPTSRHSGTGLNKRCRNERVKRELGLSWKHPRVTDGEETSVKV
jgi:nucleoside-diphosphate-sugar epimerase